MYPDSTINDRVINTFSLMIILTNEVMKSAIWDTFEKLKNDKCLNR